MPVILLRIKSLILSKQLYGQLFVQNTVLTFPKVNKGVSNTGGKHITL